jgi:colicin import membrane protein
VLDVKLVRSSGIRAYDQAVERAILKSSPLPKAPSEALFNRELELKFRPRD